MKSHYATNGGGTTSQTVTLTIKTAGITGRVPSFTSSVWATTATVRKAVRLHRHDVGQPSKTSITGVTQRGHFAGRPHLHQPRQRDGHHLGHAGGRQWRHVPHDVHGGKLRPGRATQSFVLTVSARPTITSAATCHGDRRDTGFSFTVQASGAPTPTMTEAGRLPQGLTWVDNGNGTATLAGTPGVGQGGVYVLMLSVANTFGTGTQTFTLIVDQAPAITSAPTATATHGRGFHSSRSPSTGYPSASVAY